MFIILKYPTESFLPLFFFSIYRRGGFQPRGMMRGGPMRGGQMRGGPMRGGPMRGGPMGGPRGMPFGMGPNRGGNMGQRGGGGQNRGGNMMGGGQNMNRNMGNMGGRGGQMGGQKFGGAGGPAPWGAPSPWQQQPQRQQAGGNWGNPWGQQGKYLFILYYIRFFMSATYLVNDLPINQSLAESFSKWRKVNVLEYHMHR